MQKVRRKRKQESNDTDSMPPRKTLIVIRATMQRKTISTGVLDLSIACAIP